jgi:vancomycin permeability regulator SanA
MVLVFVFQQGVILNQINQLSRQVNASGWDASAVNARYLNNSILMFRYKDRLFPAGKTDIPEKKVEELLRSIDNLKKEYKDLHEMIEKDPELKRLIEKRLSEIDGSKTKL